MKLLLERGDEWYMGMRRVVGEDLGSCWLGPEEGWLRVVEGDRYIVCESFGEALDELRGVYCSLIRLWDQYSWGGGMWVWIGSGGVEIGYRRRVGYLGEWPDVGWSRVRCGVLGLCDREYVIKREWIPGLRVSLKEY